MTEDPIRAGKLIMSQQPTLHDDADKEEQFEIDKLKGISKMVNEVKNIKVRLDEVKAKLTADNAEWESLKNQRAKISLQKDGEVRDKKLSKLNKQIAQLHYDVDVAPDTIKILEQQSAEAESKLKSEARDELLDSQKTIGQECVKLSKQLVAKLEAAVGINQLLENATLKYAALHKQTGVDTIGAKCCSPSRGYLQQLFGYLKGEIEEGKHQRPVFPTGPQI